MSQSVSSQSNFALPDPTQLSDLDCFGIFVGAEDSGLNSKQCKDTSGNTMFKFGLMRGLAAPGQKISIDVPSGPRRSIYIMGLASNGACEQISEANSDLNSANYSAPFLLGSSTKDLAPGPSTMSLSVSFDPLKKVDDCDFDNGGGGQNNYGNGVDGDQVVIVDGSELDLTNFTYTDTLANTRKFTAIERVSGISPSAGNYNLTLSGTPSLQQFRAGDDVLLYLAAGSTWGCGINGNNNGSLWPGFKVQGKVESFAGSVSTIQVSFDEPRLANLNPANLAANADASGSFCRAVLVRVPNFKNLLLTYSTNHYATVPAFGPLSGSNHNGGIIAFKVQQTLTTDSSGSSGLSVWGKGHSGNSFGKVGDGVSGYLPSPVTASNFNGGGGSTSSPVYPAGGGHGGAGGAGNPGGAPGSTVGDAWGCQVNDPLEKCLLGKMFFGGAGGTYFSTSVPSNSGGGLVSISARSFNVPVSTQFMVMANGKGGMTEDAGGAGGSILIETDEINVVGSLNLYANGGETSGFGGTGGGGRIHINVESTCNSTSAGNFNLQASGGIAYGSGLVGGSGTRFIAGPAISQPSCLIPAP